MTDFNDKNDGNSGDEQGFNEAELLDIMNEIESLEKEFVEPDAITEAALDSLVEEDTRHHSELLKVPPAEVHKTDLQKQIDEELENSLMRMNRDEAEEVINMIDHEGESFEAESTMMASTPDVDMEMMEADEILGNSDELDSFSDTISDSMEEVKAESVSASTSESISNVISMTDSKPTFVEKNKSTSSTPSSSPVSLQAEGTMSLMMNFKIGEGDVKLFVNGNQGVTLSFEGVEVHMSEEEGCVVEMTNGVKFNIPLKDKIAKRNVA